MARCCKNVWAGHHSYPCTKPVKVERDGKHYCTIHDPARVAKKRAAKDAEWNAKWAKQNAERDTAKREADFASACIRAIRIIAQGEEKCREQGVDPYALAQRMIDRLFIPPPAIPPSE